MVFELENKEKVKAEVCMHYITTEAGKTLSRKMGE